jgi:hypothetical protein
MFTDILTGGVDRYARSALLMNPPISLSGRTFALNRAFPFFALKSYMPISALLAFGIELTRERLQRNYLSGRAKWARLPFPPAFERGDRENESEDYNPLQLSRNICEIP